MLMKSISEKCYRINENRIEFIFTLIEFYLGVSFGLCCI